MKRVIFEDKDLTVKFSNITNASHIGFTYMGKGKGHIVNISGDYMAISVNSNTEHCNTTLAYSKQYSVRAVMESVVKNWTDPTFYVFNTRKELYKWLSE